MEENFQCDMCQKAYAGECYVSLLGAYESYEWCESCYHNFLDWYREQIEKECDD